MSARAGWEVRRELAGAQSKATPRVPRNTAGRTSLGDPWREKRPPVPAAGWPRREMPPSVPSYRDARRDMPPSVPGRPPQGGPAPPDAAQPAAFLSMARHTRRHFSAWRGTPGAIPRPPSARAVQGTPFLDAHPKKRYSRQLFSAPGRTRWAHPAARGGHASRPSITSPGRPAHPPTRYVKPPQSHDPTGRRCNLDTTRSSSLACGGNRCHSQRESGRNASRTR